MRTPPIDRLYGTFPGCLISTRLAGEYGRTGVKDAIPPASVKLYEDGTEELQRTTDHDREWRVAEGYRRMGIIDSRLLGPEQGTPS